MKKKGQITVFIVAGITLLIILGITLYTINKEKTDQISGSQPIENAKLIPIISFVNQCLEKTSKEALLKLGQEGRLYSNTYLASENEKVAYFYYKGDGFFPTTITVMEEDISRYVMENLPSCTGDFSFSGYEIAGDYSKVKVSSAFNSKDMAVELYYPIVVRVGDSESKLTNFKTSISIDFNQIYELSREIYKRTKSDPDWIDIGFLSEQQDKYNIKLVKVSDDTLIYEITDKNNRIDNLQYVYRFAVRYYDGL